MARKSATKREGAKAIGYVRVSTIHQVKGGISLEAQHAAIERYCTFREFNLLKIIEEPGVSGTTPLAERPGGKELFELVSQGDEVAHVVGLKLDRFFRNVIDCLGILQDWDEAGVALHLVDMGGQALDTSSGNGRFFVTVLAAFAELESTIASERIAFTLARKRELGEDLGSAPYGFKWNTETHKIEKDQDEQIVLKLIKEYAARRMSAQRIADKLEEVGIPARGERWHRTTVRRIIKRQRWRRR